MGKMPATECPKLAEGYAKRPIAVKEAGRAATKY
jgi:hypothetical protein